jgi:hypothetical protein
MKVYWSRWGHGHGNFGDNLTPLLLRHFGITCQWSPAEQAQLIGIGSLLERVPEDYQGLIWTTGFMHESSQKNFAHARIIGLRGRQTLQRIVSRDANIVLGDAGLLCDQLAGRERKRFKLGIIPHVVDQQDPLVASLASSSGEITVIDICGDCHEVIRSVGECEYIVSSSLHGLIVADSLGIPNRWIELNHGEEMVLGKGFKFQDYYSIYDMTCPEPETLHPEDTLSTILERIGPYQRSGLAKIKGGLLQTIAEIREAQDNLAAVPLPPRAEVEEEDWFTRIDDVESALADTLPSNPLLAVADEEQVRSRLSFRRIYPFTERSGEYWGPPATDRSAIDELERMRGIGVQFFVLLWPAFWWLNFYKGFFDYLGMNYPCILTNDRLMIFDLRTAHNNVDQEYSDAVASAPSA